MAECVDCLQGRHGVTHGGVCQCCNETDPRDVAGKLLGYVVTLKGGTERNDGKIYPSREAAEKRLATALAKGHESAHIILCFLPVAERAAYTAERTDFTEVLK